MIFDVEKIAKLAKIKITEAEKIKYEKDIKDIIHMLENLDNIDCTVESTGKSHELLLKDMSNMRFREDKVKDSMDVQKLLSNAPESMANCIVIPQIIQG